MATNPDPRPIAPAAAEREARYLAYRPASETVEFYFCTGNSVGEIRVHLEGARELGRYRVFDRRPATRGVDVELVGEFEVDWAGAVAWRPLSLL